MYINTFKYTPKDVSCQLCTEYVKKLGCTALRCPWLAERIEAGVVGYREAVLETFPHERRLFQRLNLLIKHYPGSLWSYEQHERRMQYQCAVQGYRRRRDTNAYRRIPLRKRRNGSLPERRLSTLAGSWQALSRAMPRPQNATGYTPSALSAWDKPEHKRTACGKSRLSRPIFHCSPCKGTLM